MTMAAMITVALSRNRPMAATIAALAQLIVEVLNLEDVDAGEIGPEEPLFGDGLGLDSIDALELAMAISKEYGVQLKADDEDTRAVFENLRSLSAFIEQEADADHVLNLVQDRYRFTVAFTAIAAAGRCNVLPPNPKPAVQAELAQRFERVAVLHDGVEVAPGLPSLRYAAPEDGGGTEVPVREASDVVAVSFTSGSTGQAAPIAKTLGMFRGAIALYGKTLLPPGAQLVATVPAVGGGDHHAGKAPVPRRRADRAA